LSIREEALSEAIAVILNRLGCNQILQEDRPFPGFFTLVLGPGGGTIGSVEEFLGMMDIAEVQLTSKLTTFGQCFSVADPETGKLSTVPLCLPVCTGLTDLDNEEIVVPMVHSGISLSVSSQQHFGATKAEVQWCGLV
jgi:hypothetical protein